MTVLVTGGAGFIGSHLVEELLDRGRDVVVMDDLSEGHREHVPEEATFYEADLKDEDALGEVFNQHFFSRVYHLAANADVRTQNEDRMIDRRENVDGTHVLLEAMHEHGVRDIVFTSSSVVYGEADEFPTPEEYSPLEPISLYGASKLAAESLLAAYAHSFGFEVSVLRLANIIGARSDHGVTYDFVHKLAEEDSELEVLGDGRQRKSYLHVDDCVDAIVLAAQERSKDFEVLNIGNTDSLEVSRIAEVVIDAYGCDAEIRYTGGEKGWTGDVAEMLLDISRIGAKGWSPSVGSEEAVTVTAEGIIADLD